MNVTNRVTWTDSLSIGSISSQGMVQSVAIKPEFSFQYTNLHFEPMLDKFLIDDRVLSETEKNEVDDYCTSFFLNATGRSTFLSNLTAESACRLFISATDLIVLDKLEKGLSIDPELVKRRQEVRSVLVGNKVTTVMSEIVETSKGMTTSEFITGVYSAFSVMGN